MVGYPFSYASLRLSKGCLVNINIYVDRQALVYFFLLFYDFFQFFFYLGHLRKLRWVWHSGYDAGVKGDQDSLKFLDCPRAMHYVNVFGKFPKPWFPGRKTEQMISVILSYIYIYIYKWVDTNLPRWCVLQEVSW